MCSPLSVPGVHICTRAEHSGFASGTCLYCCSSHGFSGDPELKERVRDSNDAKDVRQMYVINKIKIPTRITRVIISRVRSRSMERLYGIGNAYSLILFLHFFFLFTFINALHEAFF